jgi:hypothetical protein
MDTTNTFAGNNSNDHVTGTTNDGISREETVFSMKIKKPHLFQRIKNTLSNNPVPTAVGASLAIGAAALGSVNYNRYGNALGPVTNEDLREVAAAGASLFNALR